MGDTIEYWISPYLPVSGRHAKIRGGEQRGSCKSTMSHRRSVDADTIGSPPWLARCLQQSWRFDDTQAIKGVHESTC
jgi:hypothetical protein